MDEALERNPSIIKGESEKPRFKEREGKQFFSPYFAAQNFVIGTSRMKSDPAWREGPQAANVPEFFARPCKILKEEK